MAATAATKKAGVAAGFCRDGFREASKRFRAKWKPVRVKKTLQINNLELGFRPIRTEA
jgi:hypothetical protein